MQFVTLKHNAKYNFFLIDWLWFLFLSFCLPAWHLLELFSFLQKYLIYLKNCLHSSLSWGFKSQGSSTTGKKICVSGITVEVGISLVVLDAIWGTLQCLPTIEMRYFFPFLMSLLLAPSQDWKSCKWCGNCCLEQWLCSAFQFLDTWSLNDWSD